MECIGRGTTPIANFTTVFTKAETEALYVTFWQNGVVVFEKTLADATWDGTNVSFRLSQEETLSLCDKVYGRVQIRAKLKNGITLRSSKEPFKVLGIYKEGVI